MNGNIIRFKRKSNDNSEYEKIREQILTLQNLYKTYQENLKLLSEQVPFQSEHELEILKTNMKIIEEQIDKLTNLIK